MLTDEQIRELIAVPKSIAALVPRNGFRVEDRHRRCELELSSDSGGFRKFDVFIRQNIRFAGNFSIGLRCQVGDTNRTITVTLARYNGPHGETARSQDGHYALPHIHYITEAEIARGHQQPQEKLRTATDRYTTFVEALHAFFADISVSKYLDYFPELRQGRLFNEH